MFFSRIKKKDPLHHFLYSRIDKFINTTEKSRKQMIKNLSLPPEKHLVIPNAVDLDRFKSEMYELNKFRTDIGVQETSILIGLIGRIDPGKGQKEAIQAMPEILRVFPESRLVIVGEVTQGEHKGYLEKLKALTEELGIDKKVIWAGFRENIPQVLKDLDIFLMPSYQESFGKVLIEAMSMKIPVIATNKGGPPEILDNGNCGILIKPACYQDISAAVISFLTDKNLKEKCIKNALKRVHTNYSLKVVLNSIEQLYLSELNN
jgi:glycosyltransferase involved in cell wall biosynthesis